MERAPDRHGLGPEDLARLAARGIAAGEAERQLDVLRRPPAFARLERPATVGDGIERLEGAALDAALEAHAVAAAAGRCSTFVPASGAATRMFQPLLAWLDHGGDTPDDAVRALLGGLDRFAFRDALAAALGRALESAPAADVVRALLETPGLGYASLPKGLLPFHRDGGVVRTAFEEHLQEAAGLVRDREGACRLHFTVSPEHEAGFRERLEAVRARDEESLGARWAVGFSHQQPATDTLAVDGAGAPVRDADGRLLLRPAGHGALIGNLGAHGGDLALIKNVDNVAAEAWKAPTLLWGRALLGHVARLAAEGGDRPVRVCGMVRNTGEPGGGPFWVRGSGGTATLQIVETAQVDPADPDQQAVLRAATHFNPVFLAVALRDPTGRPWDLERFVDPAAAIVTRKSSAGRELVALERPGLWNGAMAAWRTVFVEVPLEVFNPVKTVLDLLRKEHQPA